MEKFEILNGRKSFYQWDYDQKLAVLDDTVTQVHFPLGTESCPPLPVYELDGQRVVDVPDILLQTAGVKRVYAFVEDAFGGRTICTETFRVNERAKPDDYIYTEQELWTAEKAVQKALQEAKDSGDFKGDPGPKGDPGVVKFKVVNELPETDTENAIYLLPVTEGAEDNLFDEYIWVNGKWEKIGSAAVAVDMTGYVKDTDIATSQKAGLVRVHGAYGTQLFGDLLVTVSAEKNQIDAKSHGYHVITPKNLDYAVKAGITANTETLTDEEKAAALAWLGAVNNANVKEAAFALTIPIRDGAGRIYTQAPLYDSHAANKAYVDGRITADKDGTLSIKLADGSTYKVAAAKEV